MRSGSAGGKSHRSPWATGGLNSILGAIGGALAGEGHSVTCILKGAPWVPRGAQRGQRGESDGRGVHSGVRAGPRLATVAVETGQAESESERERERARSCISEGLVLKTRFLVYSQDCATAGSGSFPSSPKETPCPLAAAPLPSFPRPRKPVMGETGLFWACYVNRITCRLASFPGHSVSMLHVAA